MLSRLKPLVLRLYTVALACLWVALTARVGAAAQSASPSSGAAQQAASEARTQPRTYAADKPAVRLLSLKEGRSIVSMAWGHDAAEDNVQDCSHVVNKIYRDAGYTYPYASSFELYRGIAGFVRVKSPHPGDLVTWPGHVGIVLDAGVHSFYSLVSSGLAAQDYRGAYWRSRGHARFYRYVLTSESAAGAPRAVLARGSSAADRHQDAAAAVKTASAIEKDSRPGSVVATPSTSVVGAQHAVPELARVTTDQPEDADPPPAVQADVPAFTATTTLTTANGRPTSAEVSQGIAALTNAAGGVLDSEEPLNVATPVVIFEQLTVERVELKRDHGWAHLKIDSRVLIDAGGVNFKARHDKVRWELRRAESGWVAVAPSERVYVAHDAAVRIFAARLAQLTQSDAAARHDEAVVGQEARIANLLSALLESR